MIAPAMGQRAPTRNRKRDDGQSGTIEIRTAKSKQTNGRKWARERFISVPFAWAEAGPLQSSSRPPPSPPPLLALARALASYPFPLGHVHCPLSDVPDGLSSAPQGDKSRFTIQFGLIPQARPGQIEMIEFVRPTGARERGRV